MGNNDQLGVVVCQMTSTDQISDNEEQIFSLLKSLNDLSSTDLICFPENSLFLRIGAGQLQSFDLNEPIFKQLTDFASKNSVHLFLGSVPYRQGAGVSNATVLISPNVSPQVVYEKIHLFDVDVEGQKPVRESEQFVPGGNPVILEVSGWKMGLSICYDLRFAELFVHYRDQVDIIMVPSAFLQPTGSAHWHVLLRARAIESQCYVVAAAQGGVHKSPSGKTRQTYGHSLIVSPWGEVLAERQQDSPGVISAKLNKQEIQRVRQQIPMHQHRKL